MLDAVSLRTSKYWHHKAKNLAVVSIRGRDIYLGRYGSPASRQLLGTSLCTDSELSGDSRMTFVYPSGKWRGFWEQAPWGRQQMHNLVLHFTAGNVDGSGADKIGPFTFQGTYD